MKPIFSRRQRGFAFTLVELLVVIGIIAILASVIIAGVGKAISFAKRTKANSTAVQISTAVQNYYTEYGVYPSVNASPTSDDYYDGGSAGNWPVITYALCGNINPYSPTAAGTPQDNLNTRGIAYLSPSRSDVDNTGSMINPFGSGVPANGAAYYFMVVDTDYSGIAGDTGTGDGKLINFSSGTTNITYLPGGIAGGVAVWSSC
jgi:prepilin-type N-terminal cleavage/methylation domain-containing protein